MTRSTFAWRRIAATLPALIVAASCPATSLAQSAPATTTAPGATDNTIRLSDEERDRILDDNMKRRDELDRDGIGRGVHGEIGVMIGSHGTRGIYGTTDVPLGDNAGATVSFESSRFGYGR